jgi:hypothetical protein
MSSRRQRRGASKATIVEGGSSLAMITLYVIPSFVYLSIGIDNRDE